MRITVVGAGGIGGLYGGLLARAGHDVTFLARGAHLRAIQERGLEVRSAAFGTFVVQARASDEPADLGTAELALFAVKTYDIEQAAQATRQLLDPDGCALTFQNGLEAPDQLASVIGEQRVLIGTTGLETTILEPGIVGHLSAWHYVSVSELHGPATPRVERVVGVFKEAGVNVSAADDGRLALWQKAFILMPMATITSVCRAPIGEIRAVPESRELVQHLLDEVAAVARAYGYDLPEVAERARAAIADLPPTMKASMARDFERGGRTELEALTGALVRMGQARDVPVPATRTAYAILKLRQQMLPRAAEAENPLGIGAVGR